MTGLTVDPVGAVLAVAFTATVGSLVWWMLHPRAAVPVLVAAPGAGGSVLVGVKRSWSMEALVTLASALAAARQLELVMVYVVEVPMVLPLDASMPQLEAEANEALAQAQSVVPEPRPVVRTYRLRARKAGRGLVEAARQQGSRLLVIGAREGPNLSERVFGTNADYVLRHAPCEVVIARPAAREQ